MEHFPQVKLTVQPHGVVADIAALRPPMSHCSSFQTLCQKYKKYVSKHCQKSVCNLIKLQIFALLQCQHEKHVNLLRLKLRSSRAESNWQLRATVAWAKTAAASKWPLRTTWTLLFWHTWPAEANWTLL